MHPSRPDHPASSIRARLAAPAGGLLLLGLSLGCTPRAREVSSFGPLEVGQPLPSFITSTPSRRVLTQSDAMVFIIEDGLPPTCYNKECGLELETDLMLPHLIGISDPTLARRFGIEPEPGSSSRLRNSLIVVSDDDDRIRQIHVGATARDLIGIASDAGLIYRSFVF